MSGATLYHEVTKVKPNNKKLKKRPPGIHSKILYKTDMAYQNSEKNRWMLESMNSSLKELILDPLYNTPK